MKHIPRIQTSDEFIYDLLHKLMHKKEVLIIKKDITSPKALKTILNKYNNYLSSIDKGDSLIIRRLDNADKPFKFHIYKQNKRDL